MSECGWKPLSDRLDIEVAERHKVGEHDRDLASRDLATLLGDGKVISPVARDRDYGELGDLRPNVSRDRGCCELIVVLDPDFDLLAKGIAADGVPQPVLHEVMLDECSNHLLTIGASLALRYRGEGI